MGKLIILAFLSLTLIFIFMSLINASLSLNLKPLDTFNNTQPNTFFNYQFDFTTDSSCLNILLTEIQTIQTFSDGTAFTTLDISSLTQQPSYLCVYINSIKTDVIPFDDLILNSLRVNNITADSGNFSGNVTADYFHGKLNYSDIQNTPIISGSTYNVTYDTYITTNQSNNTKYFNGYNLTNYGTYLQSTFGWISSFIELDPIFSAWLGTNPLSPYELINNLGSDIVNNVGNWSQDKTNYWNSTQILNGTLVLNSSLSNYYPYSNPSNYTNNTNLSQFTNDLSIAGDNSSWNESYANTIYTNFSSFNSTQMSYSNGFVNIILSWIDGEINRLINTNSNGFYNITNAPTYINDTWGGNQSSYYNITQIDNNFSLYYLLSNPFNFINSTNFTNVFFTNSTDNNITVNNLNATGNVIASIHITKIISGEIYGTCTNSSGYTYLGNLSNGGMCK